MKISYDPRYNIAYIRFREKTDGVDTIRVSDELNVDMAPDGTVYGIELLNANEQLRHLHTCVVVRRRGEGDRAVLACLFHSRRIGRGSSGVVDAVLAPGLLGQQRRECTYPPTW